MTRCEKDIIKLLKKKHCSLMELIEELPIYQEKQVEDSFNHLCVMKKVKTFINK